MGTGRAGENGSGASGAGSGGAEPVAWSGPEGAQAFAAVDAATDWLLGYPFVLLATDPACSGTEYASLRIGEPGREYGPGDDLSVRLRLTDGTWQVMPNHAWPVDVYPPLLEQAGFRDVVQQRPTVDEALGLVDPDFAAARTWSAERARPPLVITTALAT